MSQSSFKIKDESSIDHRFICHLPSENEKKLARFLRNNFVCLPHENVDSGRTKSTDKRRVEGVISKEMLLSRSTSVLSYSATVHHDRPAHLVDGLSSL